MGMLYNPRPINENLHLFLDGANRRSAIKSGTTWYDLSRNKTNATFQSVNVTLPSFSDMGAGSLEFDGVDAYCNVDMVRFGPSDDVTLEAFVYPRTFASYTFICGRGYSSTGYPEYGLRRSNGNLWEVRMSDATANYNVVQSATPVTNTWYHVLGTLNRTTNKLALYVNAEFIGDTDTTALGNMETAAGGFKVGSNVNQQSYTMFDGFIAMMRVYTRSFTHNEVIQNFNAFRSRYGL